MKNIFRISLMTILIVGLLGFSAPATVTYDDAKTVTVNLVDALIAMANAKIPFLNDVLFVDSDRTDDYTADGSLAAPYKTIAAAKAASVSGDVIIVSPGAYAETVTLTTGTSLFGWNVTGATLTGNYVLFNGATASVISPAETHTNTTSHTITAPDIVFSGFTDYNIAAVAAQSYTISSSSKASRFISTESASEASTVHFLTNLLSAGREIKLIDGGAAANTHNIVVDTEGAETINGANTLTISTASRVVTCISDGSNWFCY